MVTLTFTPLALGKVGTPHARPSAGPANGGAPKVYVALSHKSRSSDPKPHARALAHGLNADANVLAYGSGYTTTHGSQAVRALQRRLAGLGYQPGPIDGRYGPMTDAAVMRFQATHGLPADGIAGVRTVAALAAAKPALYPGQGYGSSGSNAVRSLQRHLAAAGFSAGPIDGRYGALTERAVTRFQSARHLRVDGIAGPQTLNHLQAVHSPTTPHRQHQTPPRRSTGQRPAPAPRGTSQHGNPAPQPTRQPRRHSGGFPLVWLVVLAGLLLAVLASMLWHRRRGADAETGTIEADRHDHYDAAASTNGAHAEVPEDTPIMVGAAEAAGGASAPENARQHADEQDTAGGASAPENARQQTDEQDTAAGSAVRENGSRDAYQQDGAAAYRLGLLRAEEGDRAGAADAFQRAGEHGHADAAFNLGVMLVQEGDAAGAKDAFQHADRRGHAGAAFDLGMLLLQEGDLAGAKEAFRRAEKRGHPEAAFDLGALLVQEGDYAGAEDAFRRADAHGDGGAACNLGVLLEERGDVVGAKEAYQRSDMRGHRVGACNLGALLEQQGDIVAAKEAYRRADQRGDSAASYHLGVLLEREGDREAAKDAYRRAAQSGHPEGACKLGLLLKDEGDHAGAIRALQRAGERGSPEVLKVARAALVELDPDEEDGR